MTSTEQRRRARDHRVPGAGAPNWLLVVVAGAITGVALLVRAVF
ncbi:MAG TPA: hypothetical protein VFQ20_10500 [Burkholderiaceae bacterium]|nr:hypothetical protein [Burkholderiaceae bacterium]